ncbi:hypothetical protein LZ30DRAFT_415832 [Colletotrichum cereale]|nr:hypothetical protein LZ30DRAFT_415832 [Colletotrichum cereale]
MSLMERVKPCVGASPRKARSAAISPSAQDDGPVTARLRPREGGAESRSHLNHTLPEVGLDGTSNLGDWLVLCFASHAWATAHPLASRLSCLSLAALFRVSANRPTPTSNPTRKMVKFVLIRARGANSSSDAFVRNTFTTIQPATNRVHVHIGHNLCPAAIPKPARAGDAGHPLDPAHPPTPALHASLQPDPAFPSKRMTPCAKAR